MDVRVACVGGGAGGLFFAALLKRTHPDAEVTLFERNRPGDTFGFGVVLSDKTLDSIREADPVLRRGLGDHCAHWDAIEVRVHGERLRCGGNGMAAIARKTLLALLHERAAEAGADLRFEHEVHDPAELGDAYDLVVAADGANSPVRDRFAERFRPSVSVGVTKFIWLGTPHLFRGLTFIHKPAPNGVFAAHAYPYGREGSTFIVETDEASWARTGLDAFDTSHPPGVSDEYSRAYLEALFADQIEGQPLWANNSRWSNFRTVRTGSWRYGNLALLGDAAHTAHFSVGSGTKMAMEDAVTLARCLADRPHELKAALAAYEAQRRPAVERIQGSARPSLSWWEHFGRYHDCFGPLRFAFHFFTRSLTRAELARRDPGFVAHVDDDWWHSGRGADPLETPLDVGEVRLPGRAVPVTLAAADATAPDGAARNGRNGASDAAAAATVPTDGGDALPLVPPGRPAPEAGGHWGLWLPAPEDEQDLPGAKAELEAGIAAGAVLAAVHGGTRLTRTLLCEEARLLWKTPALLVDDSLDADRAATLVLSGRADLVGAAPGTVAAWRARDHSRRDPAEQERNR